MIRNNPGRISESISAIHPLFFMLLYIILIPIFSGIYEYFMPRESFYAPYAKLEPSSKVDLMKINSIIQTGFNRALDKNNISIQDSKLEKIITMNPRLPDGSVLYFSILGTFKRSTNVPSPQNVENSTEFGIELPASLIANQGTLIGPRPDETANILVPVLVDISTYPAPLQPTMQEFLIKLLPMPYFPAGRSLELTRAEATQLDVLFAGLQGNATLGNRALLRMLYFSATVATTVGFGDIVPMTPAARLAVGIQATIAIVVAGLFLNAIAYRAARRPE